MATSQGYALLYAPSLGQPCLSSLCFLPSPIKDTPKMIPELFLLKPRTNWTRVVGNGSLPGSDKHNNRVGRIMYRNKQTYLCFWSDYLTITNVFAQVVKKAGQPVKVQHMYLPTMNRVSQCRSQTISSQTHETVVYKENLTHFPPCPVQTNYMSVATKHLIHLMYYTQHKPLEKTPLTWPRDEIAPSAHFLLDHFTNDFLQTLKKQQLLSDYLDFRVHTSCLFGGMAGDFTKILCLAHSKASTH